MFIYSFKKDAYGLVVFRGNSREREYICHLDFDDVE